MGNNASDIYQSLKLSSKETRLTNVKPKFKEHFKGRVEVALIFEGTQFVRRLQLDKEGGYAIYRRPPDTGLRFVLSGIYWIKWPKRKYCAIYSLGED